MLCGKMQADSHPLQCVLLQHLPLPALVVGGLVVIHTNAVGQMQPRTIKLVNA